MPMPDRTAEGAGMDELREAMAAAMWARLPGRRPWRILHPSLKDQWLRHVDTALAAIEASGTHVLAPIEPTATMLAKTGIRSDRSARAVYQAALAARPRQPGSGAPAADG